MAYKKEDKIIKEDKPIEEQDQTTFNEDDMSIIYDEDDNVINSEGVEENANENK